MRFPTGFPFMKHIGAYQMVGFGCVLPRLRNTSSCSSFQIADVGGVYAVSFVVASVNGAIADVAVLTGVVKRLLRVQEEPAASSSPSSFQRKGVREYGFLNDDALLVASIGYGFYRLQHEPFADGPLVSAIQGNVPQGEKMAARRWPDGAIQKGVRLRLQAITGPHRVAGGVLLGETGMRVTPGTGREADASELQTHPRRSG